MKAILWSLSFALLLTGGVLSQEPESTPPAPPTLVDPAIGMKELGYQLVPLTKAELEVEAASWMELLQAKASEVAAAKIADASNKGNGVSEEIDTLKEQESALMKRLDVVLTSLEAKGGDPAAMRTYLTAVRGAEMKLENPTGFAAAVRRWFEAEDGARTWAIKLVVFLAILFVASIIASVVARVVAKALGKSKSTSELLDRFATKVVRRGIFFIGLMIALSTLGINVGALLALVGGGAFIIGLALQDTLSNFANGVMLMIYQPFDVGDAVEVGGISGSVDSVSLVNTTIRSWDNKIILVPNKSVWGQTITNITGADQRRVDMTFGIGYDDDIDKALEILEKIVADHELVLADPEPAIKMHELADSSVNFICRPWAKTSDYWAVYWDVTRRVKDEFDSQGISIPYPQRDVHVHQAG